MAGQTEQAAGTDISPMGSWFVRHPIASFLVLVYATTTALVFVPKELTEPGLLPGGATPHGVLENVLGSAVPAFIVTALVSGKAGVRDIARRSFWWWVSLRWYLISLVAPLLILVIAVTILYGFAPLRALAYNSVRVGEPTVRNESPRVAMLRLSSYPRTVLEQLGLGHRSPLGDLIPAANRPTCSDQTRRSRRK